MRGFAHRYSLVLPAFVEKAMPFPLSAYPGQRSVDGVSLGLFLGYLFRPIDLFVCIFNSTARP